MKYLILSSQRSGSALLKHSLITIFNENVDGPDEWIMNPITRKNMGLPDDLDEAKLLLLRAPELLIDKMSPRSHRKVMYNHILSPKNLPKGVPIIHLVRKNAWQQAKSIWVMKKKLIPNHTDSNFNGEVQKILLNVKEVKLLAKKLLFEKYFWTKALKNRSKTLTLFYEDDILDFNRFVEITLPKIESFLQVKREVKDFNYPFVKTNQLYSIKNLPQDIESKYAIKYTFQPNQLQLINCFKFNLLQIVRRFLNKN